MQIFKLNKFKLKHEDVKWMNKHLKLHEKGIKTKRDVKRMNFN